MGLNERLEKIESQLSIENSGNKIKNKKWRLTFKAKAGKNKAKKGYVGILKINENGTIEPIKQKIEEQTTLIDGVPRLATASYVLRWVQGRKSFPVIIQPSWSVLPFSPKENHEKSLIDGSNSAGYKLLLNRMKSTAVETKKQMGGMLKWIIGLGLAGIIIYAIVSYGGF